jgi:hypothetical protein
MGVEVAMVHTDWLALNSVWVAPTSTATISNTGLFEHRISAMKHDSFPFLIELITT